MSKGSCNLEVIRDVYMRLIQHSCVDTIYGRAATMCDTQRERERTRNEQTSYSDLNVRGSTSLSVSI